MNNYKTLFSLIFIFSLTGCTNSVIKSLATTAGTLGTTGTTGTTGGTGTTSTGASLTVSNVTLSSAGNNQVPAFNLFFDTSKSSAPISNYCNISAGGNNSQTSKPCVCQYSWSESNPNVSSNVATPRVVQTPVTNVQVALVTCNAPDVYNAEIISGTQIKITVLPTGSNPSAGQFSVGNYLYTKSDTIVTGSFQDDQGHIFDNVVHYSCYQTYSKSMSIISKTMTVNNDSTGAVSPPILYASQFCANASSQGCSTLPAANFSAQSYYYSMYIRKTERGGFNQANANFICPRVTEALNSNGTTGTKDDPWPSDETFALSLGPTEDFTVGVDAHTKLSGNSDPTSGNNTCGVVQANPSGTPDTGNTGGTSQNTSGGLITSCLGFAAPVNSDGTCPFIKDSNHQLRPTYRLRKYIAIYPRVFSADGSIPSGQTQGVDTVYVLDRPVKGPTTADPMKPYTMLGPKPCPFAYYDKKAVTGSRGYLASSNGGWAGKNVDGIELPNVDGTDSDGKASCSAVLPIISSDQSYLTFTTVNKNNSPSSTPSGVPHVYIRPAQPFLPHYEEDTDFKACAPQAAPLKEAPLHFSRDPSTGNVAWCAEVYPTQNPYYKSVDPVITPTATPTVPSGTIAPYTSHLVKNSASAACTASAIPGFASTSKYAYPNPTASSGYAYHSSVTTWYSGNASNTCDRTVTVSDLDWTRFPLLAPPTDIEIAINTDSSYNCTVTYDGNSGKTGKYTPSDGCCDKNSVYVCSGFGSNCTVSTKQNAHLEPDMPCKIPSY